MSGYEKSPDYGGRPYSRWDWLPVIVFIGLAFAWVIWP